MRLVVGSLLVVLAGCGSGDAGYAIDLTLVADTSIDTSTLGILRFSVSGVENDSRDIGIEGKFSSREETLRYKPGPTTTGVLDFTFTLVDREGTTVGFGAQRDVTVQPGTYQKFRVALSGDGGSDLAMPGDMNRCGNGMVDTDETCDPTSPAGCPTSVADCDDQNDCTSDSFSGSGCQATCTHTPANGNSACLMRSGDAGTSGICLNGQCCTGCIKNGQCKPGDSNARECGTGGNDCFDCTLNSASATCNAGTCSGCDATSCTADGRTCGTSSCGFNCGGCPDSCTGAGVVTKYACVNKSCQQNGGGNCGLYAACTSSTTCAASCVGDTDCIASAWCDLVNHICRPKSALGGGCSAEATGDHECASPLVCAWKPDGISGFCVVSRCTQCAAATVVGDCSGFMNRFVDKRGYCPTGDVCKRGCYGGRNQCDDGTDSGARRSCSSGYSCVRPNPGYHYLTGYWCDGNTCNYHGMAYCSGGPSVGYCSDCNATNTECLTGIDNVYACQP